MAKPNPPENELDTLLSRIPGISSGVTLESLQTIRDQERIQACAAMDEMAKQFAREDEERKKLWGNKYPPVLGQKPPELDKPINPVKGKKAKTRKTGKKGRK